MHHDPHFEERQQLMAVYRKLQSPSKELVGVLAVVTGSVSRTPLVKCLRRLKVRGPHGDWHTAASLTPILQKMERQGLVSGHSDSRWQCVPLIRETVPRELAATGKFAAFSEAVDREIPIQESSGGRPHRRTRHIWHRALRRAVLLGDVLRLQTVFDDWGNPSGMDTCMDVLVDMAMNPYDPEWIAGLEPAMSGLILRLVAESAFEDLRPLPGLGDLLVEQARRVVRCGEEGTWRLFLLREMLFRGEMELASALLGDAETVDILANRGWFELLRGGNALKPYEKALRQAKKETGRRKVLLDYPAGDFYPLALLASGESSDLKKAYGYADYLERQGQFQEEWLALLLKQLARFMQGHAAEALEELKHYSPHFPRGNPLEILFHALVLLWVDRKSLSERAGEAVKVADRFRSCGYLWVAAQLEAVLEKLDGRRFSDEGERAAAFFEGTGTVPLAEMQEAREDWESGLDMLADLFTRPVPERTAASRDKRLIWRLNWLTDRGQNVQGLSLEPVEQKLQKNGRWSRGRIVSLKRLHEEHLIMDFLSDADHKICDCIGPESSFWGSGRGMEFNRGKVLPALVDHPLLFTARNPVRPVSVSRGEPELRVTRMKTRIRVAFHPPLDTSSAEESFVVREESPCRLEVIPLKPEHRSIVAVLGEKGLSVPLKAEAKVRESLAAVAGAVEIHSDIGGLGEELPCEEGDGRIHLQLEPAGEGLSCRALVRPLGKEGQGLFPGKGGEAVLTTREGQRVQVSRDLAAEKENLEALIEGCPALGGGVETGEAQWVLENPADCLDLLAEVHEMGDSLLVEWPQGETMKVQPRRSLGDLKLKVRRQKDWFALSGEVELDGGEVMELGRLLELLEQRQGDFVPLCDGQFLALTREFRKRLEEWVAFGQRKGDGVRISPLGIPLLEGLPERVADFDADTAWKADLARFREAEGLEVGVPSTLRAELRDYQVEGFRWLARRAHWGVGACLADDMGLGKTVQALALMLRRASDGPALVVAPTSVCANWPAEAARFAPTLTPRIFGAGDRKKMVDEAGPFDLIVTSYGLLQQEAELFASRKWETIVLDEAQLIKNAATQRSAAAMRLDGNFRMIATGTPIENHLGELWNLFRFINPGLLGSLDSFNKRFAIPIERNKNRGTRARLRKLVRPFILRRTKEEVLEELPQRTEIRIAVEMKRDERVLYEALRQKALKRLESDDGSADSGEKRFAVLAEITRLRRACCHPELVEAETSVTGSKLAAFSEILGELRENGHKALVFSQFVDHLAILRRHLDESRIPYQYLDGSTPAGQRAERIRAFQAGEGDCFLISLKAGGLGLNLTAADYVIHMDPWWNPAVEDQASDRAHRIGQTRPVTVYRMVTTGSIEEKILELHGQKRDLADSLLAGTDAGGKLDLEELLRLIRE